MCENDGIVYVVLFQFSPSSIFLLSDVDFPLPPPFLSVHYACAPGDQCSLAVDTLIAVGHIEKIVLLVVILGVGGEKGRKGETHSLSGNVPNQGPL